MGWEAREGGAGPYYYRSVRRGDRVRKEYCAGGIHGQLAAQQDEAKRLRRQEEAVRWKRELELLEQRTEFFREFAEVVEIVTHAHLVANGFHRRRGEWRLVRREQST